DGPGRVPSSTRSAHAGGDRQLTRIVNRAIACVLALMCAPPAHAQERAPGKTDDLVMRVNRARVAAGAWSPELDAAAQAHSQDMVQHNYLDHTGSDRSEPQDRAGYRAASERVDCGRGDFSRLRRSTRSIGLVALFRSGSAWEVVL